MFDIQIIPAKIEQQPVIKQLLELYTYEMTDLADFDIHDNGYFGYDDLPLYWQDHNRYPYLVRVNKKLAGFVLIQKGSPVENDPEVWDVAEFFIMRKFRNHGVGQLVAQQIWREFNGRWQVRVWDNNKIAHAFWETVIGRFSNKPIAPIRIDYQGHTGLIYKFNSGSK
jgi:predicted acetyltransferase